MPGRGGINRGISYCGGYRHAVAIRPIRLLGDPVLRTVADPVTDFDPQLRRLVTDLMDTLVKVPGRAGVAAPQIGVSLRVFVYDVDGHRGHVVNPTIRTWGEQLIEPEGCLSVPELAFDTPRAEHAMVDGFDQHGQPIQITGHGYLARTLQHEYDHLDGRVYLDRLHGDTRRQALRAVRTADWAIGGR